MNIQWYPGHMAKTRRLILAELKLVDIVIELVDARAPVSSRNPDIDDLLDRKPRLLLINKSDLADPNINSQWLQWFREKHLNAILVNSINGKGLNEIPKIANNILKEKFEREKAKGIVNKRIRAMVVGIPNVGKSSFINYFAGRSSAKTGDKPGVTRGKQWINLKNGFELLDTPGILWPKFEDPNIGKRLVYIGSIKDEVIIDIEALACALLEFLRDSYEHNLKERYKLTDITNLAGYELLHRIGKNRGYIVSRGEIDTYRTAGMIFDEFRGGKIGRISLEKPQ